MNKAGLPLGMMSLALTALMVAAACFDVRSRRIPNALTLSGFGVALALRLVAGPGARPGTDWWRRRGRASTV